jgi:DNA-binding transcriptional ArsR family regulator
MARAATTTDVFNAIAEPRRRVLIALLAGKPPQPAGQIVLLLGLPQPAVSKHLAVLRKVGVISVTRHGQQRLYRLNPEELKPVYCWAKSFERFWSHQLGRIKDRAERAARHKLLSHKHEQNH